MTLHTSRSSPLKTDEWVRSRTEQRVDSALKFGGSHAGATCAGAGSPLTWKRHLTPGPVDSFSIPATASNCYDDGNGSGNAAGVLRHKCYLLRFTTLAGYGFAVAVGTSATFDLKELGC